MATSSPITSNKEADALEEFDTWLQQVIAVLAPLLTRVPDLGSMRFGDLIDQAALAWRLRGGQAC